MTKIRSDYRIVEVYSRLCSRLIWTIRISISYRFNLFLDVSQPSAESKFGCFDIPPQAAFILTSQRAMLLSQAVVIFPMLGRYPLVTHVKETLLLFLKPLNPKTAKLSLRPNIYKTEHPSYQNRTLRQHVTIIIS